MGAQLSWLPARTTDIVQSGGERYNNFMYTVYVLQDSNNKFYKGMTNNLFRRLQEHKRGKTITTSKMDNLKVVYVEKFNTFEEARKRELYFKTAAGRKFLKNKIKGDQLSWLERYIDIVKATGSSPVSPTICMQWE